MWRYEKLLFQQGDGLNIVMIECKINRKISNVKCP